MVDVWFPRRLSGLGTEAVVTHEARSHRPCRYRHLLYLGVCADTHGDDNYTLLGSFGRNVLLEISFLLPLVAFAVKDPYTAFNPHRRIHANQPTNKRTYTLIPDRSPSVWIIICLR